MGDNVCVSNHYPFPDWPARISNMGVEVVISMRKCVLPSREASTLVAEIGPFGSLLAVLLVCGCKELSLFCPNNSMNTAFNHHELFLTCELGRMTGRTFRLLHLPEASSRSSCTFWVLHHWPNMHEIPASIDLGGIEIYRYS